MPSKSLYSQVVRITYAYLGPAAERFINRQVTNHLNKPPEKINKRDLTSLIDWIRITVSLLTDDQELVSEYISELQKLLEKGSGEI